MARYISPAESLARRSLAAQRTGVRVLLVEGPPGTGKSSLATSLAAEYGYETIAYQCHHWTTDEELFVGVNVPAAVAGDAANVPRAGVLLRAAVASRAGGALVLIDEIDKAPERAEHLLLDVLQEGRVPVAPGVYETFGERLVLVLTSNGTRAHTDALIRRCRRLELGPLPVEVLDRVAADISGAPLAVVVHASKLARSVAEADGKLLSVQELALLAEELGLVTRREECAFALEAWAARGPKGRAAARAADTSHLWGEICATRRPLTTKLIHAA